LFPLYAFIREELNTKIMTPRIDHTPQEDIQKVFDAIVDGRITVPLLQCLNGFIN
jgi:phenylalanine ammonia-lyase